MDPVTQVHALLSRVWPETHGMIVPTCDVMSEASPRQHMVDDERLRTLETESSRNAVRLGLTAQRVVHQQEGEDTPWNTREPFGSVVNLDLD